MKMIVVLSVTLLILLFTFSPVIGEEDEKSNLLEKDREIAAASSRLGILEAIHPFLAEDALLFPLKGHPVVGRNTCVTSRLSPFLPSRLKEKGVKPVLIVDELQVLDRIYMNEGRDRRLIIELFNFFVSMTKESHLVHVLVASSDSYFINTVFTDSRLIKASEFYKVDYVPKADVMDWLLNLDKYSRITDYKLTPEDAGKIWDAVGGSLWEVQYLLSQLFEHPIDEVLALYRKKIRGTVAYYIGADKKKEKVLRVFLKKDSAGLKDFIKEGIAAGEVEELLRDMVRNNILYFDPTEAAYYPQGESYRGGIRFYFETLA